MLGKKNYSAKAIKLVCLLLFLCIICVHAGVAVTCIVKAASTQENNAIIFQNTVVKGNNTTLLAFVKNNIVIVSIIMVGIVAVMALLVFLTAKAKRSLRTIAYVDKITGLDTLIKFKKDVSAILEDAGSGEYMLLSVDINDFKYINDIYGYEKGNQVLKIVASFLKTCIEDPSNTRLCRFQADDFIYFTKKLDISQMEEDINKNSQKIIDEVGNILDSKYSIKLNIGRYVINDVNKDLGLMIDYAEIAKKQFKDNYECVISEYTEQMKKDISDRRKILFSMETALNHDKFVPFFQPKYDLKTKQIVGAESLVRWATENEYIQPNEFIPLLEKSGFIHKVDLRIFEKVCELIQKLKAQGKKNVPRISVNLSRKTLTKPCLSDTLKNIMSKYDIVDGEVEIELTESVFDELFTIDVVLELKTIGLVISIDDFGSGYSSLNLLKDIPADIIKIDKGFLSESINSERGKIIIASIIDMTKELNIETVAEGVETELQADTLKEMGCDLAQGYLYSRPVEKDVFETLLM